MPGLSEFKVDNDPTTLRERILESLETSIDHSGTSDSSDSGSDSGSGSSRRLATAQEERTASAFRLQTIVYHTEKKNLLTADMLKEVQYSTVHHTPTCTHAALATTKSTASTTTHHHYHFHSLVMHCLLRPLAHFFYR